MRAVIMAGGRGTRISSVASDIPKPLIPVAGVPVLERQIACLREQGITDIIQTVGHLWRQIQQYFGEGISPDTGRDFGVKIQYFVEDVPMGNAGALLYLQNELQEDFLLINGDLIFSVDLGRFIHFHEAKGGLATVLSHPNSHPFDSGILYADADGAVSRWLVPEDDRPDWYPNRVNAGIHILSPVLLEKATKEFGLPRNGMKVDLDRDILRPLAGSGRLYRYDSPEYVKDMGTPERYAQVCRDVETGLVEARSLARSQKAVFLDRDGTLNKYVGFLTDIDDMELIDGVGEALCRIHDAGYLAIVITNQPVIARGEITEEELRHIHEKLETLLGREGAYLDGIYYCPHHPDGGYPGEIASLKMECDCRKPKPGLLLRAAEDFNIDLAASWMVGDGERDIQAGQAAGCRTALLDCEGRDYGQNETVDNLSDFANILPKL